MRWGACVRPGARRLRRTAVTAPVPAATCRPLRLAQFRLASAVRWLGVALLSVSVGCSAATPSDVTVVLVPGQDIQAAVTSAPEGALFVLEPGLYRQQSIYPKSGQRFLGRGAVVLSGAMQLGAWRQTSGFWETDALPEPLRFHGTCESGHELCSRREDLFLDGRLYERAPSLRHLGPGRWYSEGRRAYLADDPTGRTVELGVTPLAFGGDAEDVIIERLTIERYASDAQQGAIQLARARGWRLIDVTARWNHGVGLVLGPATYVLGGSFSHNGQLGIGGSGDGSMIDGAEISYNNYAGYDPKWEAGGTKFWRTKDLVVRQTCVHDNAGPGLWADGDNIGTLYDGNMVFLNENEGIKHEISYDAIIRNNLVSQNGVGGFDIWLWGSQILVQNSSNVKVYDNRVEVAPGFGNGIGIIEQARGNGMYGPRDAVDNSVHDNTIVHLGRHGLSGVVADTGDPAFWPRARNRFDRDIYIVPDGTYEHWTFQGRRQAWAGLAALEQERQGSLIVEQRAPRELSCSR